MMADAARKSRKAGERQGLIRMTRMGKFIRLTLAITFLILASHETQAQNIRPKSPTLAFALSGLGTLIPGSVVYYRLTDRTAGLDGATFAILAAGSIVGPALGHIYTENYDRVWGGITLRLVSGLASTAGTFLVIITVIGGGNPTVGALLLIGGIIVAGTSAMLDIIRAPASAQLWNDRHKLAVYPSFYPELAAYGVAIGLTF